MAASFSLMAESPKRMTGKEECALLARAVGTGRAPGLTVRLAELYNRLDAFDAAIALLDRDDAPRDHVAALALVAALAGRGTPEDLARGVIVAARAEALCDDDAARAHALERRAGLLLRLGRHRDARALLARALDLDPRNAAALRRLAALLLRAGRADEALALADAVEARGAMHAQLLDTRLKALAQCGDLAGARALAGVPRWLRATTPEAPPGWENRAAFHAAIMRELDASPGLRAGRHGTASIATTRIDEPATAATPAMRALQALLVREISALVAALPASGHPWLAARPACATLRLWCVMTGAEGRERWHMHPQGWASGGYYVAVPDAVRDGDGPEGCLEFGLPDDPVGAVIARDFGTVSARPRAGLLMLFPSHVHHRTHPHRTAARRICIAFDLMPGAPA